MTATPEQIAGWVDDYVHLVELHGASESLANEARHAGLMACIGETPDADTWRRLTPSGVRAELLRFRQDQTGQR